MVVKTSFAEVYKQVVFSHWKHLENKSNSNFLTVGHSRLIFIIFCIFFKRQTCIYWGYAGSLLYRYAVPIHIKLNSLQEEDTN